MVQHQMRMDLQEKILIRVPVQTGTLAEQESPVASGPKTVLELPYGWMHQG